MRAWLQLIRVALGPSVIWDVTAGAAIAWTIAVQYDPQMAFPVSAWAATAGAVFAIFHGGMALNDWADRKIDREAGRKRPLVDGRLAPSVGLFTAIAFFALAAAVIGSTVPTSLQGTLMLIALVVVYDLGGNAWRAMAGPLLLALCRALSLSLGMLAVLLPSDLAQLDLYWPIVAYSMYVLFLARLAAHEEEGTPGMRAIPVVLACALSPIVLTQMEAEPWRMAVFAVVWVGLAGWLLPTAFRDRHSFWEPARVQAAVRRSLISMPALPSLALVLTPAPIWWAGGGALTVLIARRLVRRFPPE